MSYKHLLVHIDGGSRSAVRETLAIGLARRFGARLTALFAQSESSGPSLVARRASEHFLQAADDARQRFHVAAGAAGIDHDWWRLSHGEYGHVVGETVICCRYADLAIFGQHDHSGGETKVPEDLVEQVLLNSGRPVLVVPFASEHARPGRRVLIAWNGSREAARAVGDALPLLAGAERVTVLSLGYSGQPPASRDVPQVDIVAHLACHGVHADHERMVIDTVSPGDMVLNRCCDESMDLLVMGGYGQYGFPYLHRGRNTRMILRNMTLPVLLSH